MEPKTYDLVVIGSGPAGEKGAAQAAYFGKSVALIEKEPSLGGAAANTGTLPSKTLRETALFLSGFRNRDLSGSTSRSSSRSPSATSWPTSSTSRADERVRIHENLARHKVDLYSGTGLVRRPAHRRRHARRTAPRSSSGAR